jgi:hypothetical protein
MLLAFELAGLHLHLGLELGLLALEGGDEVEHVLKAHVEEDGVAAREVRQVEVEEDLAPRRHQRLRWEAQLLLGHQPHRQRAPPHEQVRLRALQVLHL